MYMYNTAPALVVPSHTVHEAASMYSYTTGYSYIHYRVPLIHLGSSPGSEPACTLVSWSALLTWKMMKLMAEEWLAKHIYGSEHYWFGGAGHQQLGCSEGGDFTMKRGEVGLDQFWQLPLPILLVPGLVRYLDSSI